MERKNGTCLVCQERTKVDDFAPSKRHHMLTCLLSEEPACFQVDVEDLRERKEGEGWKVSRVWGGVMRKTKQNKTK